MFIKEIPIVCPVYLFFHQVLARCPQTCCLPPQSKCNSSAVHPQPTIAHDPQFGVAFLKSETSSMKSACRRLEDTPPYLWIVHEPGHAANLFIYSPYTHMRRIRSKLGIKFSEMLKNLDFRSRPTLNHVLP